MTLKKNNTLIIAEAGVNHNGKIEFAKKLVDAALSAGADYIKFQTFKADQLASKKALQASYQIKNTKKKESQYSMLKRLELSHENHHLLIDYCKDKPIKFLSTAFDLDSIEFLKDKIDFYKIPSGEITNLPYLEKVASLKLPIIMSTGMATLKEVKDAFFVLINQGIPKEDITILHCNTEYPTPMEDVNLKAMLTLKNELGVSVGYSDHTLGIEIPIAAVAMGATVIEKHFTLDKTMEGPDHKASLEPDELKAMVSAIRNVERAMGNGIKKPSKSEIKNIYIARKSIVAAKHIKKGEVFSKKNVTVKRPGDGISAMNWYNIIGKISKFNYKIEDKIIE